MTIVDRTARAICEEHRNTRSPLSGESAQRIWLQGMFHKMSAIVAPAWGNRRRFRLLAALVIFASIAAAPCTVLRWKLRRSHPWRSTARLSIRRPISSRPIAIVWASPRRRSSPRKLPRRSRSSIAPTDSPARAAPRPGAHRRRRHAHQRLRTARYARDDRRIAWEISRADRGGCRSLARLIAVAPRRDRPGAR